MFDIKFLRENPDAVQRMLASRNTDVSVDEILAQDEARRKIQHETEVLRAEQNKASNDIATLKKSGEDASDAIAAMQDLSKKVKELGEEAKVAGDALFEQLLVIPNVLDDSVPEGSDEESNVEMRKWGTLPEFDFDPKDHVDLGEKLDIIDFESGAKLARSRFVVLKGAGARLERALAQFMLDVQTGEHGYTEMQVPYLVNSTTLQGTGNLPKFADDLFRIKGDQDLWLIPTAEVPLTNIYAGEILSEEQLPQNLTAYTPCFRSEAGSYGKDTRGMIRQHQFNKVEMVKFVHPETSMDELETMTGHAEAILQKLELPYKVVTLCSGDVGFSAAKTYDLEVWLPGQNAYREISSCSNCTDFQARRANIRFRGEKGKPQFVHTLNGSGLAVGRTLIAVLENYQQSDGSIKIPEVLKPYMGGLDIIQA
ncbi:MAG: serine--tRNA ligase [Candidatus Hydrogenedentota bacterium]|nr:MAG: serine--tRNA ligase [Candidatus Hydrogenedentota bacterium]